MRKQESRVGQVGEYEFEFWECWESDPQNPAGTERHWFRSVTGLEASTEEEMLQKLSGKVVATPSFAADNPSEWDRKISRTVHLKDKDVLIETYEHFTSKSPHVPVSVSFRGPNGLVSSTYEEMLELLGIAAPAPPPVIEQRSDPPPANAAVENIAAVAATVQERSIDRSPPALLPPATLVPVSPVPKKKPIREITMPKRNQYEDEDYQGNNIEDEEEESEEDDRPWPITRQTFAEIKSMSPAELEALIENLDNHEEWDDLRDTAKLRVAQRLGAIKKADEAPRCQFMKLNGQPCGSPAIKGETICFYHGETRQKRQTEEAARNLEIPSLEDELGVQLAILRVCNQMVEKSIDAKTGRAIISALKLARRNLDSRKSML